MTHLSHGRGPSDPASACHKECWKRRVVFLCRDLCLLLGLGPTGVALAASSTHEVNVTEICTLETEI